MKIDISLLKEFERTIDTIHPETGKIPIKILGFGEISLVFEILHFKLRKNGAEAMEAELFLNSTPSFLRFLIKTFFIQGVLDRYYDLRLVIIDLLANFFKEQLSEIIPRLIKRVNTFLKDEASESLIDPITYIEVQKYYKSDKMIWVIFQNARRIDRYIKTKLLKKNYDFYLPEKIKR